MHILLVAGARPNFMKIAPIVRALRRHSAGNLSWKIIHTGQHYDYDMSQAFFEDLEIPKPDYFLDAGPGSHAVQTAKIMMAFEKVCEQEKPDVVLVVGDVNSTLACSVVAKKLLVKVAHVEAGLRSFDLGMPEEINRMVTDVLTDYFFVTEPSATENLLKEGKAESSIHFVGHVMVDNLLYQHRLVKAADPNSFDAFPLKAGLDRYAFLTMHRPSNVDEFDKLFEIVGALNRIAKQLPIVFPMHPRTRKMLETHGIWFENAVDIELNGHHGAGTTPMSDGVIILPPLRFKDALFLWQDADFVLTDSGGLQEETTALGVPCFTIRENTERPITIEQGSNTLVGTSGRAIYDAFSQFENGNRKSGLVPELWDGLAAERIVEILVNTEA